MQAGKLRHLITIQELTGTRALSGAVKDEWETFKKCWAEISPVFSSGGGAAGGGREVFVMGQHLQAISDVRIVIRYVAGLTPKHRVSYNGRIFDILAIHNRDERNKELELLCKEHQ